MKNNIILNFIVSFLIVSQSNGLPLSNDVPKKENKPDEQNNLFEGDMRFPQPSARGVVKRGNTVPWPNGVVPYVIASGYESEQEQFILSTMRRMENSLAVNNALCIDFRPKTSSDKYYITIRNDDGCSSYVGYNAVPGQEHTVSLEHPGCTSHGIIMHELLHTLGFYHEQSRPDRDNYVKVHTQNIQLENQHNFNKYDNSYVDTKNTPYDYESVMHYRKDAFSNGAITIEPLDSNIEIGQRIWMSALDIHEVRLVYNCSSNGIIPPAVPTTKTVSNYSTALTTNDKFYTRPGQTDGNYYFKAIQIVVDRAGVYAITSLSSLDTLGYLYEGTFNSLSPSSNLYTNDDDKGGNNQFKIGAYLEAGVPYTLVVSTFGARTTGPFSLVATGPGNVQYIPVDSSVTTTTSTTTRPSIIYSNYANTLTSNSPSFSRDGTTGSVYYYKAIEVTVKTTGIYTFESLSSLDTYGYLYKTNFNPSSPSLNRLLSDDDGAGSRQFRLTSQLQSNTKYILVFTTYGERVIGQFDIVASGPDDVSFTL